MPSRLMTSLLGVFLLSAFGKSLAEQAPGSLLGFEQKSSQHQFSLEKEFDSALDPTQLGPWMKRLTSNPHHLGSRFDREVAEFVASQFQSWGYETEIEKFEVLFPVPQQRLLELIEPEHLVAKLDEPSLEQDQTSRLTEERLPPFNAYSIDGDVKGQLVYVNYGLPKDYEYLASRGIDVQGKIVITRYGGAWRGIKPKVAAEQGAIGCIIYSDPRDDGYFQGDDYPKGPWRNEWGAQRGSVLDMPLYPGDPLTPGIAATASATRIPLAEAKTITKIPVLPISYGDALPLLRALQGRVAPEDWRGALPITYHVGPGPAVVHLKLKFQWNSVPTLNVIARLHGSDRPDEWVIRGNHHDAWVFGAMDPISGLVAMMEEARAVAGLTKSGWRPKRTILYCAWDGEEEGLLGSTEWVEAHAAELTRKAILYVNSDSNGAGFLTMGGSPSLEKFVNQAAASVADPLKKVSVLERAKAYSIVKGDAEMRQQARQKENLPLYPLGSGSDYTPFLQHLGIPSVNLLFMGENVGGSYHSAYDSFDHYTRFIDPQFDYGITLAKTAGRVVLRAANADVLPYEFSVLTERVETYLKELVKLTDSIRDANEEKKRLIKDRSMEIYLGPEETYRPPKTLVEVPYLNFSPLQNALGKLRQSAEGYQSALKNLEISPLGMTIERCHRLNQILLETERAFLRPEGLPGHPWYRHQLYAPGKYTGYDVKTVPGVREAVEQHDWEEANREVENVAKSLEQLATLIQQAVEICETDRTR
ncbi:MAG: transferrin receptor-like dimerization domain-containing protein [Terriglobia bacterium]